MSNIPKISGKIRSVLIEDESRIYEVENKSYPPLEGASLQSIQNRIKTHPECFWIYEEDGDVLGFINGMTTDRTDLEDEMYEDQSLYNPNGDWLMIFSVAVDPGRRKEGIASSVMKQVIADAQKAGRKGIVLTCKDQLLGFYSQFGFVDEGISSSVHGNVQWHQMRLTF